MNVVGDFAGFLAAVYMRGIDLIQVPTTLLAMVDSGLGGKVAVNIGSGKNMVGAFNAPKVVLADYSFLATLPCSEMVNGLVESFKHALLDGGRLYQLFAGINGSGLYARGFLDEMIPLSAGYKAKIVNSDEKESGQRALLNLGHTVAHALESLSGYQGLSHGGAVAVGLGVMLQISVLKGMLAEETCRMLDERLSALVCILRGYHCLRLMKL
jgi:3-dehydroquinate synthase